MGFGHVPGSAAHIDAAARRRRTVPVSAAQWWLDNNEVRVLLVGANALEQELLLRAKRSATSRRVRSGAGQAPLVRAAKAVTAGNRSADGASNCQRHIMVRTKPGDYRRRSRVSRIESIR